MGKKSKFAEKLAISRDFSRKKIKFHKIFRSKFLEKLADFTGNFGGKLRQETISKKQPISLDFVLANFTKIDSIFVGIIICFFKQQFARKMSEC